MAWGTRVRQLTCVLGLSTCRTQKKNSCGDLLRHLVRGCASYHAFWDNLRAVHINITAAVIDYSMLHSAQLIMRSRIIYVQYTQTEQQQCLITPWGTRVHQLSCGNEEYLHHRQRSCWLWCASVKCAENACWAQKSSATCSSIICFYFECIPVTSGNW